MGMVGAIAAYYLETTLISSKNLSVGAPNGALFGSSMAVGVIEEACKFLPLAFIIYGRKFFNEHTDGIIYFALAGLGFGLPENILYTVQFGAQTGLSRLLLTPIFHATTTGIVGYFLAKRKLSHKSPWIVALPLAGVMLLHGIYDFGLESSSDVLKLVSLLITLCLAGNLFLLFYKATDQDQDMGLSVVGHNTFCRTCGWPNPRHHLYCVHCGKNA